MRSSSFIPYRQSTQQQNTKGAVDFLRIHDKMASLMPMVTRMAALQKDCAALLPAMFSSCAVLAFESDQLQLAVPNPAIATKLKQQLPKLQENLMRRGWQVSAIRLKVQVIQMVEKKETTKQLVLPARAISSLAMLEESLESSAENSGLKAALAALLQRHRL